MKLGYMMLLVAVGAMLVIAPSAMGAKGDKAEKGNAVYGKVTAVDTTAKTITIKVQGKKDAPAQPEKTINAAGATISIPGKDNPTLADVKVDDRVAVTLTKDEKPTAEKIAVMPPHEKKK